MKKILLTILLTLAFVSCTNRYDYNLIEMKKAFERRVFNKDIENNTQTTIQYLKALSYEEIPLAQRKDSSEMYLAKIYLKSRWVYLNSSRIYNVDDTLDCYFDKDLNLLRAVDPYKD